MSEMIDQKGSGRLKDWVNRSLSFKAVTFRMFRPNCKTCGRYHELSNDIKAPKSEDLLSHAFQLPLCLLAIISDLASVICGSLCFLHSRKFLPPRAPIDSPGFKATKCSI
ncbi:hypothetical protein CFP56_024270 [Quercus suber]|uniref:Uncharacterized protein n=1 Tax=Quercus suber TaxID=58331 RepID=A0AAW0MG55_QUESU